MGETLDVTEKENEEDSVLEGDIINKEDSNDIGQTEEIAVHDYNIVSNINRDGCLAESHDEGVLLRLLIDKEVI